jgi:fructose-bisphosphate aldolase class II
MKETYGVPVEEIQEAIHHGVRKINIDTDIRLAMTAAIRQFLAQRPDQVRSARIFEAGNGQQPKQFAYNVMNNLAVRVRASMIKPIGLSVMIDRYKKGELTQLVH